MLEGLDEWKMSSKGVVKVRKFSGGTTDDLYHYLMPLLQKQPDNVISHVATNDASSCNSMPLLQKQPDNVILHVGTNDASSCNSSENEKNKLKLRSLISRNLPSASIILSKPIMRSDTTAGRVTIEEVNKQLNNLALI